MAPWYLFDSTIRDVNNINITLGHLLWETTCKKLGEKEALFDYVDGFWIWDFGNA